MAASMVNHARMDGAFSYTPKAPAPISFEKAFSMLKKTDETQIVSEVKTEHIALPPKHLSNVKLGIEEQLNHMLAYFSTKFDGVLLAYRNMNLVNSGGKIIADRPCIHVAYQAEFILFKPTIGSTLTGVINKFGKKHVVCLVHNLFNAALTLRPEHKEFLSANLLGKEIQFTVTAIYTNCNVLSLKGNPCNDDWTKLTPCADVDASLVDDGIGTSPQVKVKKKKNRPSSSQLVLTEEENGEQEQEAITLNGVQSSCDTDSPRKKKKKRKHVKESDSGIGHSVSLADETLDISQDVSVSSEKKKKKRKHRDSDILENSVLDNSSVQDAPQTKRQRTKAPSVDEGILEPSLDNSQSLNESCDISFTGTPKAKKKKSKKHKSEKLLVMEGD